MNALALALVGCDPPVAEHSVPLGNGTASADDGWEDGGGEDPSDCFGGDCVPATDGDPGGDDDGGSEGTGGADPVGSSSDTQGDESDESGESSETDGAESDSEGEDDPTSEIEVCYPGAAGSGPTCLDLVEMSPYEYPPPFSGNYDEPVRFIEVDGLDLDMPVSENFLLVEVINPEAGGYQVVQSHAIEMLQEVRDMVGPLIVRDSFRSPLYNAGVGGVLNSRHIFGDAFDLQPVEDTPEKRQELHDACVAIGAGYVETYDNGHVHCDWRNIPNEPAFFGLAASLDHVQDPSLTAPAFDAEVVREGEWLRVEVRRDQPGEGALSRTWTAYDAAGAIIGRGDDLEFAIVAGTAFVEVNVGNVRTLQYGTPR